MPPVPDVPPSLSLTGLRARLNLTRVDENVDEVLVAYLEAAFEQAQKPWPDGCGRLLRPNPALRVAVEADPEADPPVVAEYEDDEDPVTLTFPATGRRRVIIPDSRFVEVDGVTVGGEVMDAATADAEGYELLMSKGHGVLLAVPEGGSVIEVTGRFGFATIPADLREAIYALASRWWHERGAQQADVVSLGDGATQTYFKQLPPKVRLAFSGYRLPAAVGGAA